MTPKWPRKLALAMESDGLSLEPLDETTHRVRFDRTRVSTAELIRKILAAADVRDLLIEDEPIEEVIKRIYAGEGLTEMPAAAESR